MVELVLRNFEMFEEKINLGSVTIPTKQYPFAAFLMGCLVGKFHSVTDLDSLFELVEGISHLRKKKLINQQIAKQYIQLVYEHPHHIHSAIDLINSVKDGQPFNMLVQLERLFANKGSNEREKGLDEREKGLDDKIASRKLGEVACKSNDTIVVGDHSHTQELEEQELKQQFADEQFARRIQEQELKLSKPPEDLCEICCQNLYDADYEPLENCSHIFHKDCLVESFKVAISNNTFPLKCLSCVKQVTISDIRRILDSDLLKKYEEHTLKSYAQLNGDSISWCPTADCGYMFFYEKDDSERFVCEECKKQYCLNCRVNWHEGMTCKEYKISATMTEDDEKFMSFVKGKKFKQCPKCKFWVEKNQGCDHMTCKCKFQFCYKCGGVYMKCQCVEQARKQMERRAELARIKRQKKAEKMRKINQKIPEPPKRSGRRR